MTTFGKNRKIKTLHRRSGAGVVFLFFLITAGCGIPNYAYLDPPKMGRQFLDLKFATFSNTTDNNPDIFQGYQVYGKFYSTSEGIDSEANTITTFSKLISMDFLRLIKPDGVNADPAPIIFLETESEKSQNTIFTINFSGDIYDPEPGFNSFITNSINSDKIEIARIISLDDSFEREVKSFQKNDLAPEHSDLRDIEKPSGEPTLSWIYLSVFVLSYGRESDGYTAVYSEPLYLGYLELPVDETLTW